MYYLLIRDSIEVLFYSFIIYTFCLWLKTDRTKPLLAHFLAYCTLTIAAWVLELPTLTPFLISYSPVALLLFIVLHERTLQKNLVTLCSITSTQQPQEDWLDVLLSSALSVINHNKAITIVIENKDSLEHFLMQSFFINAPLNKELVALLLSSTSYDDKKIFWVNAHGLIRGVNATWHATDINIQSESPTLFNKQDALFYSLQCDALILHSNQFTRYFTLIAHGNEIQKIPVHEIKNYVKKHLSSNTIDKKRLCHENNSTKKSLTQ